MIFWNEAAGFDDREDLVFMEAYYSIIQSETLDDGVEWHELDINYLSMKVIRECNLYDDWEIREHVNRKKQIWVTDRLIMLLTLQGKIKPRQP